MKIVNYVFIVVFAMCSCATDIIDYAASISGTVQDDVSGALIQNCSVSLGTTGNECVTGNDGAFSFKEVEPGDYNITFKKTGYYDQTKPVSVITGQDLNISILMKAKSPFDVSESLLNFGDLNTVLSFYLYNNSDSSTSFKLSESPSWISMSESSGIVQGGGYTVITVNVNRDIVDYGTYEHVLTISYSGKSSGSFPVHIKMSKVKLTIPSISIQTNATDITPQSFSLTASIDATGGAIITDYGFCWSISPNPTITSNCVSNGSTDKTQEFTGIIQNLLPGTTYYAKAYATNDCGTSYSNEVIVTTKDLASDKWDGTIAKEFAGGSGTFADPYLIKTGAQLALVANYSNKNFKLFNNINLNDIAWRPIPYFSGYFDGNGNEIKNIKINRSEDNLGLFSEIRSGGTVCNVILRGVKIGDTSRNYVGSIAGTNQGNITNSQVVFIEDSYIKGNSYVGGIVGESSDIASSLSCNLSQCQVISNNTGNDILGDKYVGGIAGFSRGYSWRRTEPIMTECIVSANVAGTNAVGGILGCAGESVRIWNCGFTGKLIGERNIGGIVGYCSPEVTRDDYNDITSCYAHVDITAGKDYVGGIIGGISYNQNHLIPINACYSDGTITVPATATYIGGIGGEAGDVFCCYSTVVCTNSNYCGIARRCDAISDCATVWNEVYGYCYGKKTNLYGNVKDNDIIEALQSSGSDYSGEFDFSKIWTWSGKVGGQNVTVKCPKLKWE